MKLQGTRALVVGMEKSGQASAAFLRAQGADVTTTDLKPMDSPGFRLQNDALFAETWGVIVLSPGVPADLAPLQQARARGIDVIGDIELAAPFLRGKTIGITGSNGKTTTTSLLDHILRSSGVPAQVGGNIGTPVIAMTGNSRDDQWNVLELSSFQLETARSFRAQIGVCLNVTQNHLDRHGTMERYIQAKGNLFRMQLPGSYAVLNAGDAACRGFARITVAKTTWFSQGDLHKGPGRNEIWLGDEPLMPMADIPIPGLHNAENVLAAGQAARIVGVSVGKIAAAVRTFHAVEHRLEFVAALDGVRFYNDSKATSVDAATKAIDSFNGGLWVIMGGKDKGSDYTVLRERLQDKANGVLLIGSAAEKIATELDGAVRLIHAGTLDRAVSEAWKNARPGDTVLLAPACASFDQFQSYEHRGQVFKQLVKDLKHGAAA
jgi:UDP-N-acetylmuramoylalanine--D-glutamate ligase